MGLWYYDRCDVVARHFDGERDAEIFEWSLGYVLAGVGRLFPVVEPESPCCRGYSRSRKPLSRRDAQNLY